MTSTYKRKLLEQLAAIAVYGRLVCRKEISGRDFYYCIECAATRTCYSLLRAKPRGPSYVISGKKYVLCPTCRLVYKGYHKDAWFDSPRYVASAYDY